MNGINTLLQARCGLTYVLIACAALVVGLSGCSQNAASHGTQKVSVAADAVSTSEATSAAVFYIEQSGPQDLLGDVPLVRHAYQTQYKEICKGRPMVGLNTADEKKLGTQRVQIWHDSIRHREAVLHEQFRFRMVKPCHYELYTIKDLNVYENGREYDIDLNKNKGTVYTVEGTPSRNKPAKPPDYEHLAAVGVHKIGKSSMAGQPCVIWHSDQGDVSWCTWSGGVRAGYPIDGSQGFPHFMGTPVLWAKNSKGKYQFKTDRFVVGELPDDSIFDTPKNVQLRDTTPTSKSGGS